MRWGPKYDAIKKAFVKRDINPRTGKLCKLHQCASCRKLFPQNAIKADHIEPVIDPRVGFISWDVYIDRMFCEVENFQALCGKCHDKKTANDKRRGKDATLLLSQTQAVRKRVKRI
jgi:5-methylcytosine-specific restriction endonuclease McrA